MSDQDAHHILGEESAVSHLVRQQMLAGLSVIETLSEPSKRLVLPIELKREPVIPAPTSHSHIYFAKPRLDFGSVSVGSLKRQTIAVCNSSDYEVLLI